MKTKFKPCLLNVIFKAITTFSLVVILCNKIHAQNDSVIILLSNFDIDSTGFYDISGYFDTLTGEEYALMCSSYGLHIVDVTDPYVPYEASNFYVNDGVVDVKTWQNYAYLVSYTLPSNNMPIIDISNTSNPQLAGSFPAFHNIFIDKNGYLYTQYWDSNNNQNQGLSIYDLNPDPANPVLIWNNPAIRFHDVAVIRDRMYLFQGTDST
ncbi:MAG: hypothetical protein IIA88_12415, partial [Bacteroidetes bacterium]|nr:hypothetical protein [Bacteroidota bacterium]